MGRRGYQYQGVRQVSRRVKVAILGDRQARTSGLIVTMPDVEHTKNAKEHRRHRGGDSENKLKGPDRKLVRQYDSP